ncbi:hypothetical protein B566_EDAN015339 [Ephemera danica]|nr:hypothetical protein B566_EDAN015339 [Ephemera danica]
MKANALKPFILDVISEALKIGLDVKGIIPHIIKSFRNNLIRNNFKDDGGINSWNFIRQVYNVDQAWRLNMLNKLTDRHINITSISKMSVKLAAQVFSKHMKAAIKTSVKLNTMKKSAINTATFVRNMSDIFYILKSHVAFDSNPLQCAISYSNPQVNNKLISSLEWLQKLFIIPKLRTNLVQALTATQLLYNFDKFKECLSHVVDGSSMNFELFELQRHCAFTARRIS